MSLHTVTVLTMGGFTQGCLSLIERICIRVGAGLLDLLVDLEIWRYPQPLMLRKVWNSVEQFLMTTLIQRDPELI